jgi:hypothetical protein
MNLIYIILFLFHNNITNLIHNANKKTEANKRGSYINIKNKYEIYSKKF